MRTVPAIVAIAVAIAASLQADAISKLIDKPSAAESQRFIRLLSQIRCDDGLTVDQVVRSTERATKGKFKFRGYSVGETFSGKVGVLLNYKTRELKDEEGEEIIEFEVDRSRSIVIPSDSLGQILLVGSKAFTFYMNDSLRENGMPIEASLSRNFSFLDDAILVNGKKGRLLSLLAEHNMRIRRARIEPVIGPITDRSSRGKVTVGIEVWFVDKLPLPFR